MLCSCKLVAICCCLMNASVSMPGTCDGFKNLLKIPKIIEKKTHLIKN